MTTIVSLTETQAARLRAVADAARLRESEAIPVCLDALFVGMLWDTPEDLRAFLIDIARSRQDADPFNHRDLLS